MYGRWLSQPVSISTTILAVLGQIELHLTARSTSRADADAALDHDHIAMPVSDGLVASAKRAKQKIIRLLSLRDFNVRKRVEFGVGRKRLFSPTLL